MSWSCIKCIKGCPRPCQRDKQTAKLINTEDDSAYTYGDKVVIITTIIHVTNTDGDNNGDNDVNKNNQVNENDNDNEDNHKGTGYQYDNNSNDYNKDTECFSK